MKCFLTFALTILSLTSASAQHYSSSQIFAHNDYERALPFYTAYNLRVGYIEADIFFMDSKIFVAHHKNEIKPERTLESLYLKPLQKQIQKNGGFAYSDRQARLTLMIDLKTAGPETLKALVRELENYRDLISCPTLQLMISGNVPAPAEWHQYPSYIHFDGRPGIPYTTDQLKRISMISTSFGSHVKWDGMGKISDADQKKIAALVDAAHAKGKPFRFWATPDFEHAWRELMNVKMDVIVTDKVEALALLLDRKQ